MAETDRIPDQDADRPAAVRKWRGAIAGVILLTFIAWCLYYVRGHWRDFAVLRGLEPTTLLALYALCIGILACNGLSIKFVLLVFGIHLPAREWSSLAIATSLLNYVTPLRGGAGMRAVYLKVKYNLSLIDFVSTLGSMYLVFAVVHGGLGLGAAILLRQGHRPPPLALAVFFAAVALSAVLFMIVPIRIPWRETVGFRQLARMLHGWELLRRAPRVLAALMALTAIYALASMVQYKAAFAGVDVTLNWSQAALYTAGQGLALLITITPGALGIAEWTGVYLGGVVSCTPAQALMVQLLLRAIYVSVLLAAAPFVGRYLWAAKAPLPTPPASA